MPFRRVAVIGVLLTACCLSAARADVILQYFEARWETIEHRMPDVFSFGYNALWLPPPGRGDTGPQSVGYDIFNRFDLGTAAQPTLYGTQARFSSLVNEIHRAQCSVFIDAVLNHNGYRDNNTPGFPSSGGYPGFAVTLPNDQYGDFHPPGATGRYDMRLAGLIDIAQEKDYVYIRQPAVAGANNLPNAVPNLANRAFYPDLDLPANGQGVHPFNTTDPAQGDPVAENATGLLLRYSQWMLDVQHVDGFRIDAAKHIPEWFFNTFFDSVVFQRGRPLYDGTPTTPYSFCEVFDGDFGIVGGYIRKDGFGNRDALDFPLYFSMQSVLNANGLGDMGAMLTGTIDASDGNSSDGSRGVSFVSSHDNGPPADDNLGYAFSLTKTGYPVVYYNAREFGNRNFPTGGRGDALGGDAGNLVPTLVDIHEEYARDQWFIRWNDGDVLVYERDNVLLVGLNDNGDISTTRYDQRVVQTNFAAGTRLYELTGNAANPAIDPNNDVAEVLTVGSDQRVTIRVPRNIQRKGFVMYGPARPVGTLSLLPTASFIEPDDVSVPAYKRRLTRVPVVTGDNFTIRLLTQDADPQDVGGEDDNAVFRIDGGADFNGNGQIDLQGGVTYGFEQFVTTHSPLFGGGAGLYEQAINATQLDDGMHYLKVLAFRHRSAGGPIYESFRQPFYVDRLPPAAALDNPTNTQSPDVSLRFSRVQAHRLDRTVNRIHVVTDHPIDTPLAILVALTNSGNQMTRTDLDTFEWIWNFIDAGNHTLFLVCFEESGNVGVARVAGIQVLNGFGAGAGDINGDNAINNFDIDPFVIALTVGGFNFRADMNRDGRVDNFDIDPFVARLTQGP